MTGPRKYVRYARIWGRERKVMLRSPTYNRLRDVAKVWREATGHNWTTDETANALLVTELDGRSARDMSAKQIELILAAATKNRVTLEGFYAHATQEEGS